MRCPSCQHDNDDTKKFCTRCGAVIGGRRCPNGHTIPEGLAECPFCPRPGRAATVEVGAIPRKGTEIVPPQDLPGGPPVHAVHAPASHAPPVHAPPGQRGQTVFVGVGELRYVRHHDRRESKAGARVSDSDRHVEFACLPLGVDHCR